MKKALAVFAASLLMAGALSAQELSNFNFGGRQQVVSPEIADGQVTFQRDETLDVPHQWSTTLGVGVQYDLTPHMGIYMEPSLQYFFDDGCDLKSYRTEHPLNVTLPLGIRLHW